MSQISKWVGNPIERQMMESYAAGIQRMVAFCAKCRRQAATWEANGYRLIPVCDKCLTGKTSVR